MTAAPKLEPFTRVGNKIYRPDGQQYAFIMSAAEGDRLVALLNSTTPAAEDNDALCIAYWGAYYGWIAPHWMRDKSGWTYPGHVHEESRQRDRKQMRAFLASSAWQARAREGKER